MVGILIEGRNLGDAVIASSFLHQSALELPHVKWCIWCRPETAFLFQNLENVDEVVLSNFPMGTAKKFSLLNAFSLMNELLKLRRSGFYFSLNLVGDFRENLLGWFTRVPRAFSPLWPENHPYRRIIRVAPKWFRFMSAIELVIPEETINLYDAHLILLEQLKASLTSESLKLPQQRVRVVGIKNRGSDSAPIIGIHPFASQGFKQWPTAKWRMLIEGIIKKGHKIIAFGAPTERADLEKLVSGLLHADSIVTVSLPKFCSELYSIDLLVGLDSFSVHAAHAAGVPSIMINGSNHPQLFLPPTAIRVAKAVPCGFQPCLNMPKCSGSSLEYTCTRDVSVVQILEKVDSLFPGTTKGSVGVDGKC